jgi:peptidoglycan/xylan/chitin deacetylase (PgdA/CDA1 family)
MSGLPVTVLTFHSISESQDPVERRYSLSPPRFLQLIKRLSARDYLFATPARSFSGEQKSRNLVLTFDDGYADFYSEVFPHIGTFGLKPIVFLVANYIGKTNIWDQANGVRPQNLLSHAQILEMHRHGVEFGSHTLSHPNLPSLSHAQIRREVGDSKRRLEDFLGCEITSFAYPFGAVDSWVRAAVAEAGYRHAFTTRPGLNLCEDSFCLRRIEVSDRRTRLGLALTLATGWPAEDQIEELYRRMRRAIAGVLPERVTRTLRSPFAARRLNKGSKAPI